MAEKPYLPSRNVEVDEADWEHFMSLTEAEVDAELAGANREYAAMLDRMTRLQEYRYWRHFVLTSIMENRRRLRDKSLARVEVIDNIWREGIRRSQRSLLKHRHHLRTGVWPGAA